MEHYSHDLLQEALADLGIPCEASEWHGVATGMLSTDFTATAQSCLTYLMDEGPAESLAIIGHMGGALESAFNTIKDQLLDSGISYTLLLPADEVVPLKMRVEALTLWCRGYLFGLFSTGVLSKDTLSVTLESIVKDIDMISMADVDSVLGEEDEQSYFELVEYLRVLVLSVAEELQPLKHTSGLLQ